MDIDTSHLLNDDVSHEYKIPKDADMHLQQQRLLASSQQYSALIVDTHGESEPIYSKTEVCVRISP